jgi:hypothetical protein
MPNYPTFAILYENFRSIRVTNCKIPYCNECRQTNTCLYKIEHLPFYNNSFKYRKCFKKRSVQIFRATTNQLLREVKNTRFSGLTKSAAKSVLAAKQQCIKNAQSKATNVLIVAELYTQTIIYYKLLCCNYCFVPSHKGYQS